MGTRATRLAALSGVVFVVLIIASFAVASPPSTGSSAAKVQQYFLDHKHQMGVSALLSGLSVVFGLCFFGYLRAYFNKYPGVRWLSSIFFAGAIVFAMGGVITAGFASAASDDPGALNASSLQLLNYLGSDVGYGALVTGTAILYLAAGFIIYKSRALPVWLAWVSWVLGVLSASFILGFLAFTAMGPWALVVSILLASRNPSLEADETGTVGEAVDRLRATSH